MWNTIAWITGASILVAGIMEIIKHLVYKDKATTGKMTMLGIMFSIILSPIMYYGFSLMGTAVAMVFYAGVIFIVQKELDMKAIRPLVKKIAMSRLEKL